MKYKINPDLAYKVSPIYNQAVTLQMNLTFCGQSHNGVSYNGYVVRAGFFCDTPEEIEGVKEYANNILKGDWVTEEQHGLIGEPSEYYYISFTHRIED